MKVKHSLDDPQDIPEAGLRGVEPGQAVEVSAALGRRLLGANGWQAARPKPRRKSGANTEPKEKP